MHAHQDLLNLASKLFVTTAKHSKYSKQSEQQQQEVCWPNGASGGFSTPPPAGREREAAASTMENKQNLNRRLIETNQQL